MRLFWAAALISSLALADPAAAQKTHRRHTPPPSSAEPAATVAPPTAPAASPPVLRSAVRGLTSRPVAIGRSVAGQCRARCAERRVSCLAVPESGDCDGDWGRCLSDCAGLGYSRAPAALR
jgi:hypothetical protein